MAQLFNHKVEKQKLLLHFRFCIRSTAEKCGYLMQIWAVTTSSFFFSFQTLDVSKANACLIMLVSFLVAKVRAQKSNIRSHSTMIKCRNLVNGLIHFQCQWLRHSRTWINVVELVNHLWFTENSQVLSHVQFIVCAHKGHCRGLQLLSVKAQVAHVLCDKFDQLTFYFHCLYK